MDTSLPIGYVHSVCGIKNEKAKTWQSMRQL
jgi:hypothetical protein